MLTTYDYPYLIHAFMPRMSTQKKYFAHHTRADHAAPKSRRGRTVMNGMTTICLELVTHHVLHVIKVLIIHIIFHGCLLLFPLLLLYRVEHILLAILLLEER